MGKRLKTARKKLINRKRIKNFNKTEPVVGSMLKTPTLSQNHKAKMDKEAKRIFIEGPATATRVMSQRGFLKFSAVTGTGLAQPIKGSPGKKIMRSGKRIVPMGWTWARGSIVNRPSILAVGSPKRFAAQACPNS